MVLRQTYHSIDYLADVLQDESGLSDEELFPEDAAEVAERQKEVGRCVDDHLGLPRSLGCTVYVSGALHSRVVSQDASTDAGKKQLFRDAIANFKRGRNVDLNYAEIDIECVVFSDDHSEMLTMLRPKELCMEDADPSLEIRYAEAPPSPCGVDE